jgi:hypothetical protein
MGIEYVIFGVHVPTLPPVAFFSGLISMITFCALSPFIESALRRRKVGSISDPVPLLCYRRFRREIVISSRHVAFIGREVQELSDEDFRFDS